MFKEILLENRTEKRGSARSLIYRKGVNDAPYQTTIKINGIAYNCPYFTRWKFMLDRCYSPSWLKKHPTYVGCVVCPEWHYFMAFKAWMITKNWQGKQLDKDLLSLGKKIYSPTTCLFVTPQINSLFNTRDTPNGLPLGVYKRKDKYEVGVSLGDAKRTWIGSYSTVAEAIDAYIAAKTQAAKTVVNKEHDVEVKKAVMNYLKYFADNLLLLKTVF
jgi:hypothetical protein